VQTVPIEEWRIDPPVELGGALRAESSERLASLGATTGEHPRRRLTGWLNRLTVEHADHLLGLVKHIDGDELLQVLIGAHEAVRLEHAALHAAIHARELPDELRLFARHELSHAPADAVSLRLLIELNSARPAAGSAAPPIGLVRELWARAVEIVRVGTASDLVHLGLVPSRLVRDEAGVLDLAEHDELDSRLREHTLAVAASRQDSLNQMMGVTTTGNVSLVPAAHKAKERQLLRGLDRALADHAGVALSELVQLVASLSAFAGCELPRGTSVAGLNRANERELAEVLGFLCGIPEHRVLGALAFLSIGLDPSYPSKADSPWVFGRRRAYQSRPLVRHRDRETLTWSGFHTSCAIQLLASQLAYDCLPGVVAGSNLGRAMNTYSAWRGEVFQDEVETVARSNLGVRARSVRRRLDDRPLSGATAGTSETSTSWSPTRGPARFCS
jgi:hypothetical protein